MGVTKKNLKGLSQFFLKFRKLLFEKKYNLYYSHEILKRKENVFLN